MTQFEVLDQRFEAFYSEGLTFSEIGRKLNINVSVVSNYAKCKGVKSNFRYGDLEFQSQFFELYNQGLNDCQISKIVDKSSSAVQAFRKSQNLQKNRKNQIEIMDLSSIELGLMVGGLLGDSFIQPTSGYTASGGFTHSILQRDYFFWKYEKLNRLCCKWSEGSQIHKVTKREYFKIGTTFKAGGYLDKLLSVFYEDRIKAIPDLDFVYDNFNDFSLAAWFGDDGSKGSIATNSFSLKLVEFLQTLLAEKYGVKKIRVDVRTDNVQPVLLLSRDANRQIGEIVKPILPENMHYKFWSPH